MYVRDVYNDKCYNCKFCLWITEKRDYKCTMKGCRKGSLFEKYILN